MKLSLSDAIAQISSHIIPLETVETVPLMKAFGRISATPILARFSVPPFPISLRDGKVVPFSALPLASLEGLASISTGGRVPENTACIIENETLHTCDPTQVVPDSSFIKAQGEDIVAGECLVQKGQKIGPFDITNLASQGMQTLRVIKEARIAYVGIGDELIDVQESPKAGHIYNSNAYTMAARGEMMGARTATITHTSDTPEAIMATLASLQNADVIVTSGGMSAQDAMHSLLGSGPLRTLFKGVAMAPAGLTALSFLGTVPVVHLPGLPMSSLLGFEVIGAALIRKLYGMDEAQGLISTFTASPIKAHPYSQSIVPGFFDGSAFHPKHIAAGMINVLNRCNGFILTDTNRPLERGEAVTFRSFLAWS
ncbi:MAG: molybdopterin molybdotransferase MoeA [Campylobacterales bacterium]|nr:molybdopterin molybdotransferase MoeA [Campylobacterales bacterium]